MELNKKNTAISVAVTVMVFLLLYFSGPGSAIKVTMQQIANVYKGQNAVINTTLEINSYEVVPIDSAKLIITGPNNFRVEYPIPLPKTPYPVNGSYSYSYAYGYGYAPISNITAYVIPDHSTWRYGYGYAYDEYPSYAYGFGYAYAYNWDNYRYHSYYWLNDTAGYGGYGNIPGKGFYIGGGSTSLTYVILWPVSMNYSTGTYYAQVILYTDQVNVSSNTQNFTVSTPQVLINEIMPNPDRDWDGDGNFSSALEYKDEWIELYNTENDTVDITNWTLSDSNNDYTIRSSSVTMGANTFKVFFGSTTGIRLPNSGDTVTLRDSNGVIVDLVTYPNMTNNGDQSYRRATDGGTSWETSSAGSPPSPSGSNTPTQRSIHLSTGWNLISTPLIPLNKSVASVFSSISGNYTIIWEYLASDTSDHWKKYDATAPGGVGNDLENISIRWGYWIKVNGTLLTLQGNAVTSGNIPLYEGWNLVGYPSTTSQAITTALSSISSNYTIVWAYNASDTTDHWKKYDATAPGGVGNDLDVMSPNWGYWIKVNVTSERLTI